MMMKKDYSHFNHGWMQVVQYANAGVAFHKVGTESNRGSSLTASIPTIDRSNYQIWLKMMTAYLKTQGLWYYINGMMVRPITPTRPTAPTAPEPTGDPPLYQQLQQQLILQLLPHSIQHKMHTMHQ